MRGIDVSNWQGQVDWSKVFASHAKFAYLKATQGTHFHDRTFKTNRAGAKRAGLRIGAYHFAEPDVTPPQEEAEFFLDFASSMPNELRPALDLENPPAGIPHKLSPEEMVAWARDWLRLVQDEIGAKPAVYTNSGFWRYRCGSSRELAEYPLWLASYRSPDEGKPHPARPIGAWARSQNECQDLRELIMPPPDWPWFEAWAEWVRDGRRAPRPAEAPRRIPKAAFERYQKWSRLHPWPDPLPAWYAPYASALDRGMPMGTTEQPAWVSDLQEARANGLPQSLPPWVVRLYEPRQKKVVRFVTGLQSVARSLTRR